MKHIDDAKVEIHRFCAALRHRGLDAGAVTHQRRWWRGHTSRIHITNSPIQWAEVTYSWADLDEFSPDWYFLVVEYGVPDSRVRSGFPKFRMRPKRVRSFPIFGRVTGVRWVGSEDFGIKERLDQDALIADVIINLGRFSGVFLRARPKIGCWTIQDFFRYPSESVWAAYESIANHLLAAGQTFPVLTEDVIRESR